MVEEEKGAGKVVEETHFLMHAHKLKVESQRGGVGEAAV